MDIDIEFFKISSLVARFIAASFLDINMGTPPTREKCIIYKIGNLASAEVWLSLKTNFLGRARLGDVTDLLPCNNILRQQMYAGMNRRFCGAELWGLLTLVDIDTANDECGLYRLMFS